MEADKEGDVVEEDMKGGRRQVGLTLGSCGRYHVKTPIQISALSLPQQANNPGLSLRSI